MISAAALAALREERIDHRHKGFSPRVHGMTAGALIGERRNLFDGTFTPPVMAIRRSALHHNVRLMADYCAESSVLLAPHGKTTLAPQIFALQLAAGAWGITVATPSQATLCRAFGVRRMLLANELTDHNAVRWLTLELEGDPDFEFLCYVDSVEGVRLLDDSRVRLAPRRKLDVLVELGHPGGRSGCRDLGEVLAVAETVTATETLRLVGVAGYEGTVAHDRSAASLRAVRDFLDGVGQALEQLLEECRSDAGAPPIVSAGGSLFFTEVVERLGPQRWSGKTVDLLVRAGSYVTHDSGLYAALSPFGAASPRPGRSELMPALEIWSQILSRPEPGRAIASFGRRDASFDAGMPVPVSLRRSASHTWAARDLEVTDLNDQHAFLSLPGSCDVRVGDWLRCGISHPCTTIDKWRLVPLLDDDVVVDLIHIYA